MANDEIRLHPEHGLNPSVTCCSICGKEYGVALFGAAMTKQAPHRVVMDLCTECSKAIEQGCVLCIEVEDEEGMGETLKPSQANRTGRIYGVKREAFERVFNKPLKGPVCFLSKEAARVSGITALADQLEAEKAGKPAPLE